MTSRILRECPEFQPRSDKRRGRRSLRFRLAGSQTCRATLPTVEKATRTVPTRVRLKGAANGRRYVARRAICASTTDTMQMSWGRNRSRDISRRTSGFRHRRRRRTRLPHRIRAAARNMAACRRRRAGENFVRATLEAILRDVKEAVDGPDANSPAACKPIWSRATKTTISSSFDARRSFAASFTKI